MFRVGSLLQAVAALLFLVSSIAFALSAGASPDTGPGAPGIRFPGETFALEPPDAAVSVWHRQQEMLAAQNRDAHPAPELARPQGYALRLLLGAVWIAVLLLAAGAVRGVAAGDATASLRPVAGRLALVAALVCGAAWPWVAQVTRLGGFLVVAGMAGFAVLAALAITAGTGPARPWQPRGSLGFFAGWALVGVYSSLAAILVQDLGLSVALATLVGAGLLLGTAVEIQLRLGSVVAFSLAIMWAMIAFAAQSIGSDITVTLTAIAAVAGLAAVMVQVLS